jgi:hypothetical protein
MVLLDSASMSTPPRHLAALSKFVAHATQLAGARQLTAMN